MMALLLLAFAIEGRVLVPVCGEWMPVTHLLGAGVHPKVASERLGHSKVGITLDLYSHVMPGMQEEAAVRVDEALRAAMAKDNRGT